MVNKPSARGIDQRGKADTIAYSPAGVPCGLSRRIPAVDVCQLCCSCALCFVAPMIMTAETVVQDGNLIHHHRLLTEMRRTIITNWDRNRGGGAMRDSSRVR